MDMTEKVLERLGITESTTLALKREDDGKNRVTSLLWPEPQGDFEGRSAGSPHCRRRPRIARTVCMPDEWHLPIAL